MVMKLVMVDPSKSGKDKVRSNTFHHFKKSDTESRQERIKINKVRKEYTPIMLHRFVQGNSRADGRRDIKVNLVPKQSMFPVGTVPDVTLDVGDNEEVGNSASVLNLDINKQSVVKPSARWKAKENRYHYDPFIIRRSDPKANPPEHSISITGNRSKIKRKIKFVNKQATDVILDGSSSVSSNTAAYLEADDDIPHTTMFAVKQLSKAGESSSVIRTPNKIVEGVSEQPSRQKQNILHSSNLKLLLQNDSNKETIEVTKTPNKPSHSKSQPLNDASNSANGYSTYTFKVEPKCRK